MTRSALSDATYRAIVDGAADMVIVFDLSGEITFVNDAVPVVLGGTAANYLGRNLIDFVHPDELGRALQTLDLSGRLGAVPGSTTFRIRTTSKSYVTIEIATGTPLPEAGDLRYVFGRKATHHVALEEILRGLVSHADVDETMASVLDIIGWQAVGSMVAVTWRGPDGRDRTATTGLPAALTGVDATTDSPWAEARRSGTPVMALSLQDLPAHVRAAAREHDLGAYWIEPVDTPPVRALLTLWTRAEGPPPMLHAEGMALARDLMAVILQWNEQQRQLDFAASRDPLTGLGNRRAFFATLDGAAPGAVLYGDLDGFKPINDSLGHAAGDVALTIVAERLRAAVRAVDFVARLGGDEFGVICPGASPTDAATIADRIESAIGQPITLDGVEARVGISVGIAHSTEPLRESDVEAADAALYQRKRSADRPPHLGG